MKTVAHIVLAFTILLHGMVYSVIQGNFLLNKTELIERYCINKAKVEMSCEGKCYLSKKLKEAKANQENQATDEITLEFGEYLAVRTIVLSGVSRDEFLISTGSFLRLDRYSSPDFGIFSPPKI
jgi:hypothetical protein